MKYLFLLFLIAFSSAVWATTYYVAATGGNDLNPGTIEKPWATWQKAFNTAQPGDTVFFRNGTWRPLSRVIHKPASENGFNGTYSNPIVFAAYPGEKPILDCINFTDNTGNDEGLVLYGSNYIKLKGLTIMRCKEKVYDQYIVGVDLTYVGTIFLEQVTSHDNGGHGFQWSGYDTIYVKNCDSYNNVDSISKVPGNRADGFAGGSGGTELDTFKIAYYEGCRAWRNSDDGFDFGTSKQLQISNCWSFLNGYLEFGSGVGFKFGPSHVKTPSKRKIHHCLAAFGHSDVQAFVSQNLNDPINGSVVQYYNNSAYNYHKGFVNSLGSFQCDNGVSIEEFVNNIVYGKFVYASTMSYVCDTVFSHNSWLPQQAWPKWSWNPAYSINEDDLLVIDSTQAVNLLKNPRKPDGSLPDLELMHIKDGSDLIDGGVDIGLAFNGNAPDLGAFEFNKVIGTNNKYPSIKIGFPVNPKVIRNIIKAEVYDEDGTISKVEFFLNDTMKIGEVLTNPWSLSLKDIPKGIYSARAVVTDNLGARSTSDRIIIEIILVPDQEGENDNDNENENDDENHNVVLYPNPNNGSFYVLLNDSFKEGPINMSVINIDGRLIYKDVFSIVETNKQLDLTKIEAGIYVLILSGDNKVISKKFTKL